MEWIITRHDFVKKVRCCDCGAIYEEMGLDITLPDDQWRKITRDGCNILCGSCIAKRAAELYGTVAIRAVIEYASDKTS